MTSFSKLMLLIVSSFMALTASAFDIKKEFSAEAVQSTPGQPPVIAKMFVSKNAVRTETAIGNNTIIEIVFPKDQRRILLNQHAKTYVDQKLPAKVNDRLSRKDTSPCHGLANARCKKLGQEKIDGRNSIKWEMTVSRNGQYLKSLHWIDSKRQIPLREQFSGGTVSTMSFVGKEKINGRNTEKWKFYSVRPNGRSIESQQWYDLALKMVIRETLAGGYMRELRNIKVAKQNKALFEIPADYKQDTRPAIPSANNR